MPTASGKDIHFDVPLSNLAVSAFDAGEDTMIADQLLPSISVGKQSDKYYIVEKGAFLRIPNTLRAPRTAARRVEFEVSSDSFYAHNYALAAENAMEDMSNADIAVQLRQNSTRLVTTNLKKDQEVRVANLVTSISNVGSGVQLAGVNKWNDSGSDPIADITTGHAFVRQATGLRPNVAVIDEDTLMIVRRHPLLLDMYKYTSGGELNDDQIRQVFKVNKMLVGSGIKENQIEGAAASSVTNIWGNNVLLAHVGPSTGLQSQTFGLRFNWRPPIFPANFGVTTAVENQAGQRKVEIVEAGYYQDEKVVASELAYVIQNTL